MKNSKFEKDIKVQIEYFKQFCDSDHGSCDRHGCHKLELTSLNDLKICNQHESLWRDFVLFRINFFENTLKALFLDTLECDPDEFNQFYQYFRFFRAQCGLLPVNSYGKNLLFEKHFDQFKRMVSYFNDINNKYVNNNNKSDNLHPIYKYIVLWNGINSLLDHNAGYSKNGNEILRSGDAFGFGDKLENTVFAPRENKDNTDKKNDNNNCNDSQLIDQICNALEEYVIDELLQSNVFGTYLNKNGYETNKEDEDNNGDEEKTMLREEKEDNRIESENKKIRQKGLKLVFGIDTSDESNKSDAWNEFLKLNRYCVQDISDVMKYKWLEQDHGLDMDTGGYAIQHFIVNRLTYVIFHDLNVYHDDNIDDKSMLYPNLLTLYKFLYNFSVYCICYPFRTSVWSEKVNESFYLTQYFDLRDTLYSNIFNDDNNNHSNNHNNNNNNNNNNDNIKAILPRFNYFRKYLDKDGTLLHRAACSDYRQYCEILIKNGFSVNEPNRLHSDDSKTPYQIVKESTKSSLKPLFQV